VDDGQNLDFVSDDIIELAIVVDAETVLGLLKAA
jgi:hypothetical protein